MKQKYRRGYRSLDSAVRIVTTMTSLIVILLFVVGLILSITSVDLAFEKKFLVFLLTFTPYVVYIMLIITAAYVTNKVLDHFMRMEVIALDGSDVFEKE